MGLTVNQLVAMPHLHTAWRAGRDGGTRLVTWAHSCEVVAPWEWLGPGDLLMTTGFTIPADAADQVRFIVRLDEAGLSGIAIGQDMHAPSLTPEFLQAAEDCAFPVLETEYEVPFVAVARAVTLANESLEHRRLMKAVRVYDTMRLATIAGKTPARLIETLGTELGCWLYVVDRRGQNIFPGPSSAAPELTATVARLVRERSGALPSVLRIAARAEHPAALLVPIPSGRFSALLVVLRHDPEPDLAVLQHTATVAGLEVERLSAHREERRRLGAELLAQLLDRRIDPVIAEENLKTHGFADQELVVVAVRDGDAPWGELHHHISTDGVPHLLVRRKDVLLALLPSGAPALDTLRATLSDRAQLGLSGPFTGVRRVGDAAREAQWALTSAGADTASILTYGETMPLFLPRTITEGRGIVAKVLGDLVAYDADNASDLVASLRAFLECNRSWQKACLQLHVHKQTLVYRMQRVEQLTGRSLRETGDVAELWFALRVLDGIADEVAPA